jgi:hypothetical protein
MHDPSWFSKVSQKYQAVVESLLSEPPSEGPDAHTLAEFKKKFGPTAFVCGFYRCPRSSNGFISSQARDEHEALHSTQYNCPESNCVYSSTKFSTLKLLQKHIQQYHSKPEDPVPLLSKQRVQKKRRFEDPEDYTSAPTFLFHPHHPDILQQRLRELSNSHPNHHHESLSVVPELDAELPSRESLIQQYEKELRIIGDTTLNSLWRPDEENHSQQTAPDLKGRSPFPTRPASRALPPKKAFLDYDQITSERKTQDHPRKSALDLKAWEISQTRSSKISEHWTIPELNSFPELLKHFGSDWKSTAAVMKTKTAIMVSCTNNFWACTSTDTPKIMHYFNSHVDPGKTEYGKLVARADSIRAEYAEKIDMHGETVLGPVPAVKGQPQRFYDPHSLSPVVRKTSPQTSSSEYPVNPLDGPFAGLVDRADESAESLPEVNLP